MVNAIQKYELIRPILKQEKTPRQVSKEKKYSTRYHLSLPQKIPKRQ